MLFRFRSLWNNMCIFLSLVINIIMLASWDAKGALSEDMIFTDPPLPLPQFIDEYVHCNKHKTLVTGEEGYRNQ